jgi:amidase
VSRILDAGGEIVGKAVCEHLHFSGGSHTSDTEPVLNPHGPKRSAGGSSSGSAALVVASECDMAIGGDQGGSIRIPSSFCGAVGHTPTHGSRLN